MAKLAIHTFPDTQERWLESSRQVALVVGASLFVALCARITIPLLPLTPVPLTVQNMGVLLVGLLLGSRRGFAAMVLYLMEGMVGLPVFNPTGPGGVAQLFGATGGFLRTLGGCPQPARPGRRQQRRLVNGVVAPGRGQPRPTGVGHREPFEFRR